jgi:hypothetical protein
VQSSTASTTSVNVVMFKNVHRNSSFELNNFNCTCNKNICCWLLDSPVTSDMKVMFLTDYNDVNKVHSRIATGCNIKDQKDVIEELILDI